MEGQPREGDGERGHSYSYATKHPVGFRGGIPSLQNLGSGGKRVVNSKQTAASL